MFFSKLLINTKSRRKGKSYAEEFKPIRFWFRQDTKKADDFVIKLVNAESLGKASRQLNILHRVKK